jgi:hypothetical protein
MADAAWPLSQLAAESTPTTEAAAAVGVEIPKRMEAREIWGSEMGLVVEASPAAAPDVT